MDIFRPVILQKNSDKDQMDNGQMAFSLENNDIYLKYNDKIDNYGSASPETVKEVVNKVIADRGLGLKWNIV